jgi:thiol-disulfide isomerase/thioredoxin
MKRKIIISVITLIVCASSIQAAFINESAPFFTLPSLEGKTMSLSDQNGKIVFVNFWASWCPPCKKEFPELNELASEYKGQNFVLLAINLDKSVDRVQKFLEKNQVKPALAILLDPDAKVVADYVARSMPSSFIIDRDGKIRFVHFGYSDKDPVKWRTEIDSLLNEVNKNPGKGN